MSLTPEIKKLFEDKNLAFVSTLMKDGPPQITPTWVDIEGDIIVINTAEGRTKQKKKERETACALVAC